MPSGIWAYCRVSTAKGEQELSLAEQERWATLYAREAGQELRIFREQASAKNTIGRKIFQAMMAELQGLPSGRRPSQIVVTSLDRLSRDMTDTMIVARTLRELRIDLFVKSSGLTKTDTFAQRAALVGQSMSGEAENEARSLRMRASWERRQREGKPMSNKVPYGLQLIDECDHPAEGDSPKWVRQAFEWYASGSGTYVIAKRFKEGAAPHLVRTGRIDADDKPEIQNRAPKRNGKVGHAWEDNRIRKLLRQTRYRGLIVSAELFDRVQELLASKPRWRSDRKYEFPLSGAVRCHSCERAFHGESTTTKRRQTLASGKVTVYRSKRIRYYACRLCDYRINAERMEELFRADVGKLAADDRLLRRWVSKEPPERNVAELRREVAALERATSPEIIETQRNRAWELALGGSHASADLERQLARIEAKRQTNLEQLVVLRAGLSQSDGAKRSAEVARKLLASFWNKYDRASYEQKRSLIGALVDALGGCRASKEGLNWVRQTQRMSS